MANGKRRKYEKHFAYQGNPTHSVLLEFIIRLPILFCLILVGIVKIASSFNQDQLDLKTAVIWSAVIIGIIGLFLLSNNCFQQFTIYDEGIRFWYFSIWNRFIRWEDIDFICEQVPIFSSAHVVYSSKLPFINLIIGFVYGLKLGRGFIIHQELPENGLAVRIIQNSLYQSKLTLPE